MEERVRELFARYEQVFRRALHGYADVGEAARLYAAEFIAATPSGVMTGKNDERLAKVMQDGYAHYRAQGMKDIRLRGLRIAPIDEGHCLAHVSWQATYARENRPEVAVDFEVHYFVQTLASGPKVFGWVSGDEQKLLKERGLA
jgi:hypothetical protein